MRNDFIASPQDKAVIAANDDERLLELLMACRDRAQAQGHVTVAYLTDMACIQLEEDLGRPRADQSLISAI